jgi:hypothetical protein
MTNDRIRQFQSLFSWMFRSVKESKERPAQNETLTPTRKKNLEETKRKYRGALEQMSRL